MCSVVILIPIYKATPDKFEVLSFMQCLKVLHRYEICIVTFEALDTSYYNVELEKSGVDYSFKYFDKSYFENIEGYNRLLLSLDFYKCFNTYEYMLIYQLDAYVFRDELEDWCLKGYDFIGAPWFLDNRAHEDGEKLWKVGNGGFSLRKVRTFINLLNSKKNVYSTKFIIKQSLLGNIPICMSILKILFRYQNKINYLKSQWSDAEDLFFCLKLEDTRLKLKIPSVNEALLFAFEQSPRHLFNLNYQKLPFGCHAWQKYDYDAFWRKYIN